jgi:pyruvate/2-oxoglutarate dehydrogenase complex dihydrolipoamide dehydrogenase (E3) component
MPDGAETLNRAPAGPNRRVTATVTVMRRASGALLFALVNWLISVESFSASTLKMQGHTPPSKIVICGSGVIGASVAYYLSLKGSKATIIDRAGLGNILPTR